MVYTSAVARLTNIYYTDVFLLFAKSWRELVKMLGEKIVGCGVVELSRVGLHLNTSETKLFTIAYLEHPLYIDGCGDLLAVLWGGKSTNFLAVPFADI